MCVCVCVEEEPKNLVFAMVRLNLRKKAVLQIPLDLNHRGEEVTCQPPTSPSQQIAM